MAKEKKPENKRKADSGAAAPLAAAAAKKPRLTAAAMPDAKVLSEEELRRKDRDRVTLFVKGLPKPFADDEIKKLSPDILAIRRKHPKAGFVWLEFANEKTCEANHAKISKLKVGMRPIFVDFCGDKSKNVTLAAKKAQTHSMESTPVNKLELYVGNLPATCDRATLKGFFPNSSNISIVMKKPHGTVRHAFVQFSTEEGAREAFEKYRSLEIDGVHVSVLYARIRDVDKSDKMNAKDKKKAAKNKNRTATVGSDASASSAQDSPLKGAAPVKAVAGKFPEKSAPKQQQQKANSEAAKKAQGAPQAQSTPLTGKELQKKKPTASSRIE